MLFIVGDMDRNADAKEDREDFVGENAQSMTKAESLIPVNLGRIILTSSSTSISRGG